uniref:Uncharacterized protein n=1 Tax=Mycena chlorophos TaxID=658473 RepID=A0ABQ0LIC4_MYCCL|nr:predicted protein [Mycena chlorophos]
MTLDAPWRSIVPRKSRIQWSELGASGGASGSGWSRSSNSPLNRFLIVPRLVSILHGLLFWGTLNSNCLSAKSVLHARICWEEWNMTPFAVSSNGDPMSGYAHDRRKHSDIDWERASSAALDGDNCGKQALDALHGYWDAFEGEGDRTHRKEHCVSDTPPCTLRCMELQEISVDGGNCGKHADVLHGYRVAFEGEGARTHMKVHCVPDLRGPMMPPYTAHSRGSPSDKGTPEAVDFLLKRALHRCCSALRRRGSLGIGLRQRGPRGIWAQCAKLRLEEFPIAMTAPLDPTPTAHPSR